MRYWLRGKAGGLSLASFDATTLLDDVARSTAKRHCWSAGRVISNFDVAPTDPFSPASPKRLEDGLLGCPTPREVLRGQFATLAILDFVRRVDARDE